MTQTSIRVNGRVYRIGCEPGGEERLKDLAAIIDQHIATITAEFGRQADERLLLMAALTVADELLDARARIAELKAALADRTVPSRQQRPEDGQPRATVAPAGAAGRHEAPSPSGRTTTGSAGPGQSPLKPLTLTTPMTEGDLFPRDEPVELLELGAAVAAGRSGKAKG
ncbi:MAG: cell division protein ZapA [Rhizobiales bacterium]|nr:cell division protein ZapA [Hyphomicrobiales bacterium]